MTPASITSSPLISFLLLPLSGSPYSLSLTGILVYLGYRLPPHCNASSNKEAFGFVLLTAFFPDLKSVRFGVGVRKYSLLSNIPAIPTARPPAHYAHPALQPHMQASGKSAQPQPRPARSHTCRQQPASGRGGGSCTHVLSSPWSSEHKVQNMPHSVRGVLAAQCVLGN